MPLLSFPIPPCVSESPDCCFRSQACTQFILDRWNCVRAEEIAHPTWKVTSWDQGSARATGSVNASSRHTGVAERRLRWSASQCGLGPLFLQLNLCHRRLMIAKPLLTLLAQSPKRMLILMRFSGFLSFNPAHNIHSREEFLPLEKQGACKQPDHEWHARD